MNTEYVPIEATDDEAEQGKCIRCGCTYPVYSDATDTCLYCQQVEDE